MTPTKTDAKLVLDVIDAGLCSGVGSPQPGEMCIIAAKRYAMKLSHGDDIEGLPIGSAVRSFEIALNDSKWSSKSARAKGMRRLSVAEWGSDTIDQVEFSKLLALKCCQRLLPKLFRLVAGQFTGKEKALFLDHADKCEAVMDLNAARAAIYARYASAAASDASDAASAAASAAASDAARAASAARYASAAASAARAAIYARYASAAASDAARYASYAVRDEWLTLAADIAVDALIELKSPGCAWLDLCGEKN
jgi:hypothetical protein